MAKKKRAAVKKRRVEHDVFGLGTVVDVDERFTTIKFDEAGTRKFVTSMVQLEDSDIPRPTKTRRRKPTKKPDAATDSSHDSTPAS